MTNPMTWIYAFGDTKPAGDLKSLLGGKGSSLAEMTAAGLRVPPGFTIVTTACERFLADGGRWPAGLEDALRAQLARLEQATARPFGAGAKPLLVSVRSGAAASMPGMMDTLLNCGLTPALADTLVDTPRFWAVYLQCVGTFAKTVAGISEADLHHAAPGGSPTRELAMARLAAYERLSGKPFPTTPWAMLKECIEAVFRSWNNPRAIAYRQRHDIRHLAGTAVTVQAMWPSQVSGVLFTQDPNDLAADRIVLEAAYGLGESVVSGEVTPDRFLIRRDGLGIEKSIPGNKASVVVALGEERHVDAQALSLAPAQVRELAELGLKVEQHFKTPVDIEWGLVDGVFALLQARAIRGLEIAAAVEPARQAEIARLRQHAATHGRTVWVAHNLGETLRAPTTLTWDVIRRFMKGDGGYGRMYRDFGYDPSAEIIRDGFLELICGRIYADPRRLAGQFWSTMPFGYDLDLVVRDAKALDRPPTVFQPERASPLFLIQAPGTLRAMWRCSKQMAKARREAKTRFEQQILPDYRRWLEAEERRDVATLDHGALLALLEARIVRVLDEFGGESLKPGFFGAVAMANLTSRLGSLMGDRDGQALAATLTLALDGDTTVEQNLALWDVAKGGQTREQFLAVYGHRCSGEMELSTARWREDPAAIDPILAALRGAGARDPHAQHDANLAKRTAAEAELPKLLRHWGGSAYAEEIARDLHDARALLPYRESGKFWLMRGYALIRAVIEALAARHDLGRAIYHLHVSELPALATERERLAALAAERHRLWQAQQRLDPATVIDSAALDRLGMPPERAAGDASGLFHGDAISPGLSSGPVRIVFDPKEPGELGTGYVLVCPSTDPGWTPLFMNAKGLIVERGGVLSHGAIVARDFGIPAICLPGATTLLAAGAQVQIDGGAGTVRILEQATATEAAP